MLKPIYPIGGISWLSFISEKRIFNGFQRFSISKRLYIKKNHYIRSRIKTTT